MSVHSAWVTPVKEKLHQTKLSGVGDFIQDYGNRGEKLDATPLKRKVVKRCRGIHLEEKCWRMTGGSLVHACAPHTESCLGLQMFFSTNKPSVC